MASTTSAGRVAGHRISCNRTAKAIFRTVFVDNNMHVRMYVRRAMYVCIYVFMYVCMYVCLSVCVYVSIYSVYIYIYIICICTYTQTCVYYTKYMLLPMSGYRYTQNWLGERVLPILSPLHPSIYWVHGV